MSQKLSADYLEGYDFPVPQNNFILVEIRDRGEDRTQSGIIRSATAITKPYVIVLAPSKAVKDSEMDIQPHDIIELVDVRHLLQFEYHEGTILALIDKANVGAVYRRNDSWTEPKPKRTLKISSISDAPPSGLQIVGADEGEGLV